MKHDSAHNDPAFTLVELLVVIAIIGLLAAILLPAVAKAKTATRIKMAKVEMTGLTAAIEQYQAEYSRLPGSKIAVSSLNQSCPDFTFGTVLPDGTNIKTNTSAIISTGNNGYQNCNSELMAILCSLNSYPNTNFAYNPRKLSFFNAKLGSDNILRDPWGNPYIITLDMNYDNKCQDGFYYPLTKGANALLVAAPVMIWSFGPDGKAIFDRRVGMRGGANKDNILSWE